MALIPKSEFEERIERIREHMENEGISLLLVYGDEYRKENLRYVSNYWPLFERGAVLIPLESPPILLAAPECEKLAQEMSAWSDIRLLPEFACVTVPDEIDYPLAQYTALSDIFKELSLENQMQKIGIVGLGAMPIQIHQYLVEAFKRSKVVDANHILHKMRLIKSANEIKALKQASKLADIGYRELMKQAIPGNTELQAAGAAEGVARTAGAEDIVFTSMGTGERANLIIPRPTEKTIKEGDMVMASLAVQYEGYIATVAFPFVAGKPSSLQQELVEALLEVEAQALKILGPGVKQGEAVRLVKDYFREKGLDKYDLYPPFHGCGCAEAESPYPNERTEMPFDSGMTFNFDVSLFGHPAGSNRIEEGFVITEKGTEPLSELVRNLCLKSV